jgi:hypothetical protein
MARIKFTTLKNYDMYVYVQTEPGLFTAGYYEDGKFHPESDHDTKEEAAQRVSFLNGNSFHKQYDATLAELEKRLDYVQERLEDAIVRNSLIVG